MPEQPISGVTEAYLYDEVYAFLCDKFAGGALPGIFSRAAERFTYRGAVYVRADEARDFMVSEIWRLFRATTVLHRLRTNEENDDYEKDTKNEDQ